MINQKLISRSFFYIPKACYQTTRTSSSSETGRRPKPSCVHGGESCHCYRHLTFAIPQRHFKKKNWLSISFSKKKTETSSITRQVLGWLFGFSHTLVDSDFKAKPLPGHSHPGQGTLGDNSNMATEQSGCGSYWVLHSNTLLCKCSVHSCSS